MVLLNELVAIHGTPSKSSHGSSLRARFSIRLRILHYESPARQLADVGADGRRGYWLSGNGTTLRTQPPTFRVEKRLFGSSTWQNCGY